MNRVSPERGSIAPFALGLLVLILLTIVGLAASSHAALHAARVQNLADAAVLFAHDRADSESGLQIEVSKFFDLVSLEGLWFEISRSADTTELRLCSRWQNPFSLASRQICRSAAAKSFEQPN